MGQVTSECQFLRKRRIGVAFCGFCMGEGGETCFLRKFRTYTYNLDILPSSPREKVLGKVSEAAFSEQWPVLGSSTTGHGEEKMLSCFAENLLFALCGEPSVCRKSARFRIGNTSRPTNPRGLHTSACSLRSDTKQCRWFLATAMWR